MKQLRIFSALLMCLFALSFTGCSKEDDTITDDAGGGSDDKKTHYSIPFEDLNGWDEGLFYAKEDGTDCSYYIVSQTDSTDGSITVCLNDAMNIDAAKSLIFHFSKEGDVLKILLAGYLFDARSYDEKVDFIVYDADGDVLGGFSVPYEKVDTKALTRSPFFNSKGELSVSKIMNFGEFAKQGADVLGGIINLSEGNYGDIVADYLLGNMTASIKSFLGRIFVPLAIKEILNWAYEEGKKIWMGDAAIQITSIKRTSETTITVEGQITDINSIPLLLITVTDGVINYEENVVRYGVAVGRNRHPGLYLNENCSELKVVTEEEKFSFTFYMKQTPGEVLYFRPFLIPEYKLKGKDDLFPTPYTMIRYGDAKMFMDMDVYLSNFKQVKCVKDGENYNAQFTIDAKVSGLFEDLQNWGIKVETESQKSEFWGGYRYYVDKSDAYTLPVEMSFTCDVKIKRDDIEDIGEERIAKITITPFVEVGYNLENTYFEGNDYSISLSDGFCPDGNHVHAVDLGLSVKWACCNVGAEFPDEYGDYFAWGETTPKSEYTKENSKTYRKNIGDISGNAAYDAATANWGGSWRMPTKAEMEELIENCTREWTTVNGVNGRKVTSKINGNSIFLPAAGFRAGSSLGLAGYDDYYWSSTSAGENTLSAFGSGGIGYSWYSRYYGRSVRPVSE